LFSYELVVSFDPNLGEEKIGEMISKIEAKIKGFGGEIEKVDKWGVRKLASMIKKAKKLTQAYFVLIFFKGEKTVPGKVQNYLKVTEDIIRYSIFKGVPKQEAKIAGKPTEKEEVEAVDVGEIKEIAPAPSQGEELGQS